MKKIISTTIKHANIMIAVILLITAGMGILATKIVFNPDFYSVFPEKNKRSEILFEETEIVEDLSIYLILSVKADDALSIRKLNIFYNVLQELEAYPEISDCISPFDFITFKNKKGRLSIEKMAPHSPQNDDELAAFKNRLLNEPLAQGLVVADNGTTLNAILINTTVDDPAEFMKDFENIIKPLKSEFEVLFTGDVPFSYHTAIYLQKDFLVLVILAFIVILVVLYLSFRAFRAVFLPILTVGVGAIWSIGFSSLLGYDLTVVSIILPIIILAIGSSYTVHILSEYFRSYNGETGGAVLAETVSNVVLTVILAGVTTIIGFSSLMFTSIRPLREFGLSVSFGILTCVILSIWFLPALLSKLSPPREIHKNVIKNDLVTKAVVKVGRFVAKRYGFLVIGFIVVIVGAYYLYPEINRKVDYIDYFPHDDKVVQDAYQILEDSGGSQSINITLKAPEGNENYFIREDVIDKVLLLQNALNENINVITLTSYYTILQQINNVMTGKDEYPETKGLELLLSRYFKLIGDNGTDITYGNQVDFINDDKSQITLLLKVYDGKTRKMLLTEETETFITAIENLVNIHLEEVEDVYIWGNTIINYDAAMQIQKDQLFSSFLSMLLIFAVATIFFRSFKLGLLTLIPLIFAIAVNYIIMVVFSIPLDVTTVLVANVAIGVGVDDAIHFILQYQKQITDVNQDYSTALQKTFLIAGRPIVLTTVSIVAGFLILYFASFKPIVYFGVLVSISLSAAMFASLIFLPAFLLLINKIREKAVH